jgi:hypothetical protein
VNKTVRIALLLLIIVVAIVLVTHAVDFEAALRKLHGR